MLRYEAAVTGERLEERPERTQKYENLSQGECVYIYIYTHIHSQAIKNKHIQALKYTHTLAIKYTQTQKILYNHTLTRS